MSNGGGKNDLGRRAVIRASSSEEIVDHYQSFVRLPGAVFGFVLGFGLRTKRRDYHGNHERGWGLSPLVTHRFKLDDIEAAYELFAHQRDGVMRVAITP
nr:hypothetical protein [Pseudomonas sp. GL-B-16]